MNSIYIGSIPNHIGREDVLIRLEEIGYFDFKIKGKPKVNRRYLVLQTKSRAAYQSLLLKESLLVKGAKLIPQPFLTGKERREKDFNLKRKRIYVSDLPQNTSDKDLKSLFARFGVIKSAYISKKCKKKAYKYGFVTF
jgi:hypothetical protein